MAHPRIVGRTLVTAGTTAALTLVPLAGSALALGAVEDTLAPVTAEVEKVLPAPVADAVEETAPVVDAVEEATAPVLDEAVNAAPAPVREAAGEITGPKPSAGPVETAPVPAPVAPRGSAGTAPSGPSAPESHSAQPPASSSTPTDSRFQRAREALASTPMSTTPLPSWASSLTEQAPMTAAADGSRTPVGQDVPGWLIATATGLVMLMGAAHIVTADGRMTRTVAR